MDDVIVLGRPYRPEEPGRPVDGVPNAVLYTSNEFSESSVNDATETVIVVIGTADDVKRAKMLEAAKNVANAWAIVRERYNLKNPEDSATTPSMEAVKLSKVQALIQKFRFKIVDVKRSPARSGAVYKQGNKIIDELYYDDFEGPDSYADSNYDQYGVLSGMVFILLHEVAHVTDLGQMWQNDAGVDYRERTKRNPSGPDWEASREFIGAEANANGLSRTFGLIINYDFNTAIKPTYGWGAGW